MTGWEFKYDSDSDILWFESVNLRLRGKRNFKTEILKGKGLNKLYRDRITKEVIGGRIYGFINGIGNSPFFEEKVK